MRALRDELDLRRKTEIHEIEERKNSQINTLMKNHERAFSEIKNYYNDITLNNLALINTLKVSDDPQQLFLTFECLFNSWHHMNIILMHYFFLQEQVEEMKKKEERMEKQMAEVKYIHLLK